jgi:phage terminase large subunit
MMGASVSPLPIREIAPYEPLPWQLHPLRDKSLIVLMTGSAGGGKSRTAGEKGHAINLKYPGATGLVVRKTREAANRSCVPMLWQTVIGGECSGVQWNKSDNIFRYPNGSVIYTGGMKDEGQREAIRSIGGNGALDWIWAEEANALTFEDFQELKARLRGRAAPWLQMLLTTNPGPPSHWINQKLILGGEASVYTSGARDNPHNPPAYLQILETLTGVQRQRLVEGLWVQAEGVIYDNFSLYEDGNVTEEAEYNPAWPIVWGVDDGYAEGKGKGTDSYHPRVFLLGQFTPQGGVNIFAEYYRTLEVEEMSLANVLALPYPPPEIAYVDSSAAQLKARIWAQSIHTAGATHTVTEGIKNVRRLICDGKGVRLLKIHPRCRDLINEIQSYTRDESVVAVGGEQKPAKVNDHGPDALRYMTWRLRFDM